MRVVYFLLFCLLFIYACKHKVDFNQLPIVSYSATIEPIISGNCTQSGCHGSKTTGERESFPLISYEDLINNCRIVSGNPDKSNLYNVVNTYNENNVMPRKPYNKLTEQQIELIYVWIGQGAKNN